MCCVWVILAGLFALVLATPADSITAFAWIGSEFVAPEGSATEGVDGFATAAVRALVMHRISKSASVAAADGIHVAIERQDEESDAFWEVFDDC